MTDAPIIPTKTTKVRFPILVAWDAEIHKWVATSLLTGAYSRNAISPEQAYDEVCWMVKRQFKEGTRRKDWALKLDEAPECAFRDWVVAHFWGSTAHVIPRLFELSM